MASSVREAILESLQQLGCDNFKRFKHAVLDTDLEGYGRIKSRRFLEQCEDDVTDSLIQHYTNEGATRLVAKVLQKIKQIQVWSEFQQSLAGAGHQQSSGAVVTAAPRHDPTDPEDRYDMSGDRRAFVLSVQRGRDGAKDELSNLRTLLGQFNITMKELIDPREQDIIPALKKFRDAMPPDVSCSFVFIMAHGDMGMIFGTDRRRGVKLEEIISLFNNENCPVLQLKPKVFVIQACRGGKVDPGANCSAASLQKDSEHTVPKKLPTLSDTFIVYPAHPGYIAYHHSVTGSLMVTKMMDVFRDFGTSLHLSDLFVKVNQEVVSEEVGLPEQGLKTTLVMESTLTKAVYLTQ